MTKLKIGILGSGSHAVTNIFPILINSPEFDAVAIQTRTPDRAEELQKKFNIRCVTDEDLLLTNFGIDAVYISSPNYVHHRQIKKAISLGKHILVEKSAFCNLEVARVAVRNATGKNLILHEAFMYRYHKQFEILVKIIQERTYGKPRFIDIDFGIPHLQSNNIRYDKALGGGALNDVGAYTVSAVNFLLTAPVLKYAKSINESGLQVDTSGYAIFDSKNAVATCKWAFGLSYKNTIKIWTDDHLIEVERAFSKPESFNAPIRILKNGELKEEIHCGPHNHFKTMLSSFSRYIRTKETAVNLLTLKQAETLERVRNYEC